MNKIKIIDLLNKIANGEEVKKFIYEKRVFYSVDDDYWCDEIGGWFSVEVLDISILNTEVEIIEDVEELTVKKASENFTKYSKLLNEEKEIEKLKIEYDDGDIGINGIYLTSNHSEIFANKINELIDVVNELKRDKK